MKSLIPAAVLGGFVLAGAALLGVQAQEPKKAAEAAELQAENAAAQTYENLANAIIAIEKTEDDLVRSILIGYNQAAQGHLRTARRHAENRKAHVEDAAEQIANIANEGDKAILAIRQRLAQAGHTHNTDVETKEDYMFITAKEKKELLALAQEVAQLADKEEPDFDAAIARLQATFAKAIAPEQ